MKNSKTNNGTSTNGKEGKNKISPLEKFFTDQLKDIYYAEQQLVKALPEMQHACTTEELEDAFENHLKQTERQLKTVFLATKRRNGGYGRIIFSLGRFVREKARHLFAGLSLYMN